MVVIGVPLFFCVESHKSPFDISKLLLLYGLVGLMIIVCIVKGYLTAR